MRLLPVVTFLLITPYSKQRCGYQLQIPHSHSPFKEDSVLVSCDLPTEPRLPGCVRPKCIIPTLQYQISRYINANADSPQASYPVLTLLFPFCLFFSQNLFCHCELADRITDSERRNDFALRRDLDKMFVYRQSAFIGTKCGKEQLEHRYFHSFFRTIQFLSRLRLNLPHTSLLIGSTLSQLAPLLDTLKPCFLSCLERYILQPYLLSKSLRNLIWMHSLDISFTHFPAASPTQSISFISLSFFAITKLELCPLPSGRRFRFQIFTPLSFANLPLFSWPFIRWKRLKNLLVTTVWLKSEIMWSVGLKTDRRLRTL